MQAGDWLENKVSIAFSSINWYFSAIPSCSSKNHQTREVILPDQALQEVSLD